MEAAGLFLTILSVLDHDAAHYIVYCTTQFGNNYVFRWGQSRTEPGAGALLCPFAQQKKAVHAQAMAGVDELARTYASADLRGARSARLLGRALRCSQISQAAERCRCSETFALHCGLGTYGPLPKTRLPVFCVRGATPPDRGRSLAFAKCRALLPGLVPAVQYDHFTGAPSATEVSEVEAGQGTRRLRSESSARPASAAVPSATDP